ncbi:MAG: OmpA family protein [Planctomycetales bacterium]|nr:OmpA family protein [Planctomycetales bacterium]
MTVVLVLFMVQYAVAQEGNELNFQTTEQGIIKSLTEENPKIKTRSLRENKTRAIKIVGRENNQITHQEITVSDDEPIQSVNLKIEFDVNSYNIRPDSYELLNKLGKALTSENLNDKAILIKGHTDSDGNDDYNLNLSLNRAQAVKSYLVGLFSIPELRLKIYGYGKTVPLVPDNNPANKQINRRVEIAVDQN